jgi:hypothetical protein
VSIRLDFDFDLMFFGQINEFPDVGEENLVRVDGVVEVLKFSCKSGKFGIFGTVCLGSGFFVLVS